MEDEEYGIMYRVEDTHWWYRGMSHISMALLRKTLSGPVPETILDAGCGTGAFLVCLRELGDVTGVDLSPLALECCRKRGLENLIQASILEMPFENASFDLITSFDVLSECGEPQDEAGLQEFSRVLRPGGRLLLRLPAYKWIRGKHDTLVHTRHRYTRREIINKVQQAGLQVEHTSYANSFLFPLACAKRFLEKWLPMNQQGSDLTLPAGPLNSLFERLLKAETPLVCSTGLPFGLTIIVLAKKPEPEDAGGKSADLS